MPTRPLPPLTAIRAFEAAARHLSVTGAAAELGVTPGAVSRQVRELERELGTALFVRGPTGLRLTGPGQALAEGASEALDRLAAATGSARIRRGQRLTVGVYGFFASRALLPLWPDLGRELPEAEFEWHTSSNPLELLPGRYDAVIAVSDVAPRAGLVVRPLMAIATVPVCAPGLLRDEPVDFGAVPLLHARPRPEDWRRWLDHAGLGRIPVRGGSTFESLMLAMDAAASGLGVAIGIEALLGPDLAAGRVVVAHPARRPTRRQFTLQFDARHEARNSLHALAEWLAGRLPGGGHRR